MFTIAKLKKSAIILNKSEWNNKQVVTSKR